MTGLPLKTKFIISVVGLLLIVLFLGAVSIYSNYRSISLYAQLDKKVALSYRIALVLHQLQKERGTTIGFMMDHDHFTKKELSAQREETDRVSGSKNNFSITMLNTISLKSIKKHFNSSSASWHCATQLVWGRVLQTVS